MIDIQWKQCTHVKRMNARNKVAHEPELLIDHDAADSDYQAKSYLHPAVQASASALVLVTTAADTAKCTMYIEGIKLTHHI